jgi:hypothetical protein
MNIELKDWLNSINFTKENYCIDDPTTVKNYPSYIINKCLSAHIDCILYSNEMNMNHQLDKDMQYAFYLNSIRKRKRFSPWIRKEKISDLECVKSYYGYSNEKASQALKILNRTQLNFIKKKLDIGGQNDNTKH